MVRRSCRLCLRLAILSARNVGLDLFVFTNSEEYCPTERTNKQLRERIFFAICSLMFRFYWKILWLSLSGQKLGSSYTKETYWNALRISGCLPAGWMADSWCSGRGQCKWRSCGFSGPWTCSVPWPRRDTDGPEVSDMQPRSGTAPSQTRSTHRDMWWGGTGFMNWTNTDWLWFIYQLATLTLEFLLEALTKNYITWI